MKTSRFTLHQSAIGAYLLLMPWITVFWHFSGRAYDLTRICEILLMLACGTASSALAFTPNHARLPLQVLTWGALAAVFGLLSLLHSEQPLWAIKEAGLWVGMGLIATTLIPANRKDVERLMLAMVGSMLFYNCLNLLLAASGMLLEGVQPVPEALTMGYENRRFFNAVQSVALPIIVLGFARDERPIIRAMAYLTTATGVALIFATGARSTLLATSMAILITAGILRQERWATICSALLSGAAGAMLYAAFFLVVPVALDISAHNDLSERIHDTHTVNLRLALARIAADQIAESPILGIGPLHFAHRVNRLGAHPHNVYLQIAAEWGLPMLVIFTACFTALLKRMAAKLRQSSNKAEMTLGAALFAAIVSMLVDGLFSGNFVMPVSQVWIAVSVGLSLNWISSSHAAPPLSFTGQHRQIAIWAIAVAATSVVAYAAWLTIQDAHALEVILKTSDELGKATKTMPRYWSSGWF